MLPKPTAAPTAATMNAGRLDHRSRGLVEVVEPQTLGVSITWTGEEVEASMMRIEEEREQQQYADCRQMARKKYADPFWLFCCRNATKGALLFDDDCSRVTSCEAVEA